LVGVLVGFAVLTRCCRPSSSYLLSRSRSLSPQHPPE
jgi:hypothetical protein